MKREDMGWATLAVLVLLLMLALAGKVEDPQFEDGSSSNGTCQAYAGCDDSRVRVTDLEQGNESDHWAEGDDNADGWLTPDESGWASLQD